MGRWRTHKIDGESRRCACCGYDMQDIVQRGIVSCPGLPMDRLTRPQELKKLSPPG